MKKLIIASIVICIIAVTMGGYAAASFLSKKGEQGQQSEPNAQKVETIPTKQGKPVKVANITQETIAITQTFYGTVTPHAEANIQGKYSGKLIVLKGQEGDQVKAGEVIVRFDDSDTRLQLEQATANKNTALQNLKKAQVNLETVQKTVDRQQSLFKDNLVSKQTLDEVQNQLQAAQSGVDSAGEQVKNAEAQIKLCNNMLQELTIKAPISGIIDQKNFNLNEIPKANDIIYHIVAIDQVYIEVEVPELYISQIREQMEVDVLIDSLKDQQFKGVVEHIIPTGNTQSRTFIVKVLVANPAQVIKPGMFVQATACLEKLEGVLIMDKKAVIKENGTAYVFKVVETHVEKCPVEVKQQGENTVAVVSAALAPQDRVVVEGARLLNPNDLVNVL